MKQPDQSDRLEKLVNQLKEQLHVLGSESHEDSILKGLVDVQGLTEMTQGMLKDAERRLAGCRQHAPGPRNAPFLVPFTDASCSGSLIENDQDQPFRGPSKQFSAYLVLGVLGLSLAGYALHEHRLAQNFAAQAEHEAASLKATRSQIDSLSAAVNELSSRPELRTARAADIPILQASATSSDRTEGSRSNKGRSQFDRPGKTIEDPESEVVVRHFDLTSAHTELTSSIPQPHDELALSKENGEHHDELAASQNKGEHSDYEFDIGKSKQFQHDGPLGIRLKKANVKHQYADLELLIDGRSLSEKHVNLYQPEMFYTPAAPAPVELLINSIDANHIHGYLRIPKYGQPEVASVSNVSAQARIPTK